MGLLSSLFRPQELIDAVKARKVHIKGAFVLMLTGLLTFFTMLPVFGILLAKIFYMSGADKGLFYPLKKALMLSGVLLLLIPFVKWWGQSVVIRASLKTKRPELERPTFAIVLLGRSFGLIPMILLIPLKVLLISPQYLMHHIFYPPLSALLLTGLNQVVALPAGQPFDLFILTRAASGVGPSFTISAIFFVVTYVLTVRKIQQLSQLPKGFLMLRVLGAVVLWDLISFGVLLFAPSLF